MSQATWSLVLACIPCCVVTQVVAIVLGVRVLRSSRGEVDHGRSLAIVALTIAGAALTGTLGWWLLAPHLDELFGPARNQDGSLAERGEVSVESLRVGDCLADLEQDAEIASAPAVACLESHAYEAFHAFEIDGDDYPGSSGVIDAADQGCVEAFGPFVGKPYRRSVLQVTFTFPTETSWRYLGDRTVLCFVGDPSGPTVGTLRDAGR